MHPSRIFSHVWGRFDPAARFVVIVRVSLVAIAVGVIADASDIRSWFEHAAPSPANTDAVADATAVRVQAAPPQALRAPAAATATPVSATPQAQRKSSRKCRGKSRGKCGRRV